MSQPIEIPIKVGPNGQLPQYASPHAAGCDLFATQDMTIRPGQTCLMPLEIVIALPEGMEAQVRPRSGLSLKTDLRLPNSPGTIDADYRNPCGVILQNTFNPAWLHGQIAAQPDLIAEILADHRPVQLREIIPASDAVNDPLLVNFLEQIVFLDSQNNPYGTIYLHKGDRIAQMVISRHERACFVEHPAPETIGVDRGGGFGSTGR